MDRFKGIVDLELLNLYANLTRMEVISYLTCGIIPREIKAKLLLNRNTHLHVFPTVP